jgi:hypothetical protein
VAHRVEIGKAYVDRKGIGFAGVHAGSSQGWSIMNGHSLYHRILLGDSVNAPVIKGRSKWI